MVYKKWYLRVILVEGFIFKFLELFSIWCKIVLIFFFINVLLFGLVNLNFMIVFVIILLLFCLKIIKIFLKMGNYDNFLLFYLYSFFD